MIIQCNTIVFCVFEIMILEKTFTYGGLQYKALSNGKIIGLSRNRVLKTRVNRDGYEEVSLGSSNNNARNGRVKLHRIIAELFVDNDDPSIKKEVNHIDFNRLNNDYSNLEWVSHESNIKHSVDAGNYNKSQHAGESNGRSKLNRDTVFIIKQLIDDGCTIAEIARKFNVGWTTIQHVKNGDTRKGIC